MKLSNEALNSFEVEIFFRKAARMDQIDNITNICKMLGKYMILDRDMLQLRLGEKISLAYIFKAAQWGLITELQYEDERSIKDQYFYTLNVAGISLLKKENYPLHELPLTVSTEERCRILTFNGFSLQRKYVISMEYAVQRRFEYFIAENEERKKTVVCYFPQAISENNLLKQLSELIKRKKNDNLQSEKSVYEYFSKLEPITNPMIEIGTRTRGVYHHPSSD